MFQEDLMPSESILWTGQPDPRIRFTKGDIFFIPFFTIAALTFLMMWVGTMFAAFSSDADRPSPIFAITLAAFPLFGLYAAVGRFYYKKWRKKRTFYAVTDKRALEVTTLAGNQWRILCGRQSQSVDLNTLQTISKDIRRNGSGTIIFGKKPMLYNLEFNTGMEFLSRSNNSAPVMFFDLRDANEVYELVMKVMHESNLETNP